LAVLYASQGRYAEAEPLYTQALEIMLNQLGEHHPQTQIVGQNFVGFLQQVIAAGRTAELSDLTQARLAQWQSERKPG